jgi:hypothetical protein
MVVQHNLEWVKSCRFVSILQEVKSDVNKNGGGVNEIYRK